MRRLLTVTATVLAAVCLAACTASPRQQGARIMAPGFLGAGAALPNTRAGTPYVFGDVIICLDKPGLVTIDSIEVIDPTNGLHIDDFAVIPNAMESGHYGYGDNSVPIAQVRPPVARPVVMTKKCPTFTGPLRPDPQAVALLLQYSKPTDASATGQGIKINYTSAGRKESISLQWGVDLCANQPGNGLVPCAPDRA
ncbi:MAG TPA: hypothetical protein VFR11_14310 [Micromonosporaceae bacterium]|jgi:hypothetical protein|nr:hypothetical protein [Micromonosporaceae bacterium]